MALDIKRPSKDSSSPSEELTMKDLGGEGEETNEEGMEDEGTDAYGFFTEEEARGKLEENGWTLTPPEGWQEGGEGEESMEEGKEDMMEEAPIA